MNSRQQYADYCLDIYGQVEFVPVRGNGSRLYGEDGREVIDLAAGIAVNALGHANPDLIQALNYQAEQLWHVSNIMVNQPALALAKTLTDLSCCDRAFICNSGTEAIEAGLKLARRYALKHFGAEKHKIVSFQNSFHGRTLFAVSVGGQAKYSQDFAPLPPGIVHGIFNDCASAEQLIDQNTAVVIVEPIQAEGGVRPASAEFLQKLRQLCDQHQAILMFDEVQTGIGRTGKLFAYQNYAVEPDIISLAKALGGGFPIGAMLVKQRYQDGLELGSHGTTFGGNPLACAVANKVLEIINTQQLLEQVIERSNQIKAYLTELNYRYGLYQDIRGCGLLIGAQLANLYTGQAKTIMQLGFDYGVASLIATPEVNRFTPALNISTNELELGLSRFTQAVEHFMANQA